MTIVTLFVKTGGLAWIMADTAGKAFGKLRHGNPSGDSLFTSIIVVHYF